MTFAKILIVEDEGVVALDIEDRLIRFGYQVVGTAASGEEALNLAAKEHPDLALMDIRLQGELDGIETARQLRARFNVPVIYLSAHADDATLQRAKVTEPFGYLVKPFQERELHSTLEMALSKVEMENQLKRHAARLQHVVSGIPDGVALLDAQHRVMVANPQAQEFLKALAGAAVGDVVDRLGEHTVDLLAAPVNDRRWREIIIPGQRERIVEASALLLAPADKTPYHAEAASDYLLLMRDVTADRELQQRIQLQDHLAAIGQFSAGIAHDFNNILSSIHLSAQLIPRLEPNLSPKVEARLSSISKQVNRASELIRQILDFSRASVMEMRPFDVVPLVKELAKMVERMLPENIALNLNYPATPCIINGDATRILQLLMNLTLNSRDAMPHGGSLQVEANIVAGHVPGLPAEPDQDGWVLLKVTDNGNGIAPDVLPHIFEPFFTTKSPEKGTGLGLAQVYGIVEQHGGHIQVQSQPGQGTSFSIYFPAPEPLAVRNAGFALQPQAVALGARQTILIVEDNADARDSLGELLESMNYRILKASNGRQALETLERAEPTIDLILTDVVMPDMGGVDLCREIRHRNYPVKIISMTGYAAAETRVALHDLDLVGHLDKPIDINRLSKCIEEAFRV